MKPEIELLSFSEEAIATATAECYGISPDTPGLVTRVIKQGHLAILRHGFASVRISNISRVCGRQILRKAHADYMERSQRYFESGARRVILPDSVTDLCNGELYQKALYSRLVELYEITQEIYRELRNDGIRKEDARYILPQAVETSIVMSGNLQMWWDFFNLRIDKRVQEETRNVAIMILNEMALQTTIFESHPKLGEFT